MENKKSFVYVVSLAGKDAFGGPIICVMEDMADLNRARAIIKDRYNIEFEETPCCSNYVLWRFNNITNNADIRLIVEIVNVI